SMASVTVIHLQLLHVRLHPYQIKRRCVACFSKMHGFCFSDVEIAVTSDGNTIVCYHPTEDVPYELTQPIVRPDAVSDHAETHEQVLKARLGKEVLNNKQAPTIEELSKIHLGCYQANQYQQTHLFSAEETQKLHWKWHLDVFTHCLMQDKNAFNLQLQMHE
uniref:Large ribosomal subunit protein mL42 n=2 Tax=Cyprinus carpio TaxID=7962 RepID=A0A8C1V1J6_CYPCA